LKSFVGQEKLVDSHLNNVCLFLNPLDDLEDMDIQGYCLNGRLIGSGY